MSSEEPVVDDDYESYDDEPLQLKRKSEKRIINDCAHLAPEYKHSIMKHNIYGKYQMCSSLFVYMV